MTKQMTITNLYLLLQEVQQELINLGYYEISDNYYSLELNNRYTRTLGTCEKISSVDYKISLNSKMLAYNTEMDIKNTLMHELIHSIKGCMNHGKKFQLIATEVNRKYSEYNIGTHATKTNYTNIYRKELKKHRNYKYLVKCQNCNEEWRFKRETELTKTLKQDPLSQRFRCPYCGHRHFTYNEI